MTSAGRALALEIKLCHLSDQGILGRKMRGRRGSKIVTQNPKYPHLEEDDVIG